MKYEQLSQIAALFKPRIDEATAGQENVARSLSSVSDALTILHRVLKKNGQLEQDLKRGQLLHLDSTPDKDGLTITGRMNKLTEEYIAEMDKLITEIELMVHS